VGHGAGRVGSGGVVKRQARFLVAERVQQSGSARHQLLRRGVAGGWKVYCAEAGNGVLVFRVIVLGSRECSNQNQQHETHKMLLSMHLPKLEPTAA